MKPISIPVTLTVPAASANLMSYGIAEGDIKLPAMPTAAWRATLKTQEGLELPVSSVAIDPDTLVAHYGIDNPYPIALHVTAVVLSPE